MCIKINQRLKTIINMSKKMIQIKMRKNKTKNHFLKVTLLLILQILLSKNTHQNLNYQFIRKLLLKLLFIKLNKMFKKKKFNHKFKNKNLNVQKFKFRQTLKMIRNKMINNLFRSKVKKFKLKVSSYLLTLISQSQIFKKVIIKTVFNNL